MSVCTSMCDCVFREEPRASGEQAPPVMETQSRAGLSALGMFTPRREPAAQVSTRPHLKPKPLEFSRKRIFLYQGHTPSTTQGTDVAGEGEGTCLPQASAKPLLCAHSSPPQAHGGPLTSTA